MESVIDPTGKQCQSRMILNVERFSVKPSVFLIDSFSLYPSVIAVLLLLFIFHQSTIKHFFKTTTDDRERFDSKERRR